MARLVARALRVGRSALMQTDSLAAYQGKHRLSYLMPALLWPGPAVLALSEETLALVLQQDIPALQAQLPVIKSVQTGNRWPHPDFRGLLVTSSKSWINDRIQARQYFPPGIPTLIDGTGSLEAQIRAQLQTTIGPQDWETLVLAYPGWQSAVRDFRARITHAIFQHPANPYHCHLLADTERALLLELYEQLVTHGSLAQMPAKWQTYWQTITQADSQTEYLRWSQLNRATGTVLLSCGPADIHARLKPVWQQQPVVLVGAALDADPKATQYRQRLGLGEMTCLSFGPDRHNDSVQLYLPDRLPMPNTVHFQPAVLQEIRRLLTTDCRYATGPSVIVVGDMPLQSQIAVALAAEFGSRVQVEKEIDRNGILISGWDYWRSHSQNVPTPGLLIIPTLPIPSLENPLVAGRVAAYKRKRQDWFKAYLLPEALSSLQQAVAPVRSHSHETTGVVALLDNRVNHRSYGKAILESLSPIARISHIDSAWMTADGMPAL